MHHESTVLMAIENSLPGVWKQKLLENFLERNPSYRGAKTADVISLVHSSDGLIRFTEPFWEEHGARWAKLLRPMKDPDDTNQLQSLVITTAALIAWDVPAIKDALAIYSGAKSLLEKI